MSYTTYKTKGIVLGYENRGEANRVIFILTEDLGVVRATAQSLREIKSKQRYGLQLFSHSEISLVFGKSGWRIIGAVPARNFGLELSQSIKKYSLYVRATSLIRRLVQGEEPNKLLFKEMLDAAKFLSLETVDEEELQFFETLLVLRILNHLGYWNNDESFPWIVDAELSQEILLRSAEHHSNLVKKINASLKETQL